MLFCFETSVCKSFPAPATELHTAQNNLCAWSDDVLAHMIPAQVGFFKVVVLPLLESFTNQFKASLPLLNAAQDNDAYWQTQQSAA
jgi:hypothetical protein